MHLIYLFIFESVSNYKRKKKKKPCHIVNQ